jgi:hypothetical protein
MAKTINWRQVLRSRRKLSPPTQLNPNAGSGKAAADNRKQNRTGIRNTTQIHVTDGLLFQQKFSRIISWEMHFSDYSTSKLLPLYISCYLSVNTLSAPSYIRFSAASSGHEYNLTWSWPFDYVSCSTFKILQHSHLNYVLRSITEVL